VLELGIVLQYDDAVVDRDRLLLAERPAGGAVSDELSAVSMSIVVREAARIVKKRDALVVADHHPACGRGHRQP
jgi:hypothetical protein